MDLTEAILTRRSIRRFKPDEVPDEDLKRIIATAAYAPNAENMQPYRFILVKDRAIIKSIYRAVSGKIKEIKSYPETAAVKDRFKSHIRFYTFFARAPVVIAAVVKPFSTVINEIYRQRNLALENTEALQSISAAIQNILLAAHEKGYGTCWMTGPLIAREEIERVLGVREPEKITALIPLGVTASPAEKLPRKPLEEIADIR